MQENERFGSTAKYFISIFPFILLSFGLTSRAIGMRHLSSTSSNNSNKYAFDDSMRVNRCRKRVSHCPQICSVLNEWHFEWVYTTASDSMKNKSECVDNNTDRMSSRFCIISLNFCQIMDLLSLRFPSTRFHSKTNNPPTHSMHDAFIMCEKVNKFETNGWRNKQTNKKWVRSTHEISNNLIMLIKISSRTAWRFYRNIKILFNVFSLLFHISRIGFTFQWNRHSMCDTAMCVENSIYPIVWDCSRHAVKSETTHSNW